jgi:hypothetical protein
MRADRKFPDLPLEAVALLGEGRLDEAIKSVRTSEGVGRREARRRVDAYLVQDPIVRVQIETQRSAMRRKFFFWFLIIDLAITAAIIYWFFYRGSA